MTDNREQRFSLKRALVIFGILFVISLGGVLLFSKRNAANVTTTATAIPPTVTVGEAVPEGEQYSLNVLLSEGQSQPQTVETLPLASGETLSTEEIEQII